MPVHERLKTAREALGLKISAMADELGMSFPGYRDNENGKRVPKSTVIEGFLRLGINANWLLTGQGPMMLADQAAQPATPASEAEPAETDLDLLSDCIQAVDEVLSAKGVTLAAAKKARMIGLLYEIHRLESMHTQQPAHVDRNKVVQLVQVAS